MLVTRFHPCCLVLDLLLLVQSLWLQASSASRSQPVEALYGGASTVSDPVLSAAFTVTPQPTHELVWDWISWWIRACRFFMSALRALRSWLCWVWSIWSLCRVCRCSPCTGDEKHLSPESLSLSSGLPCSEGFTSFWISRNSSRVSLI